MFAKATEKKVDTFVQVVLHKEAVLVIFSQALISSQYLVGYQLSCADVQLLETTLMLEEKFPTILSKFPIVKVKLITNAFCS